VEVHLVELGGAEEAEHLERGDVHLSFFPGSDARFRSRPLLTMYLLAVLLKSYRRGHRATLEIDDLVDMPLLLTRRGFASREWFDTAT
jgi:LysR family transcriptional regulator, cyn operon transcriptional activator